MIEWQRLKRSRIIHLCFAVSFFTSGILINLLQFLVYLIVRPLNKRVYRKIMYYLCYALNSQLVFMGTWWTPVDVKLYVDPDQYKLAGKVSGLLLMNHSYEIDWLIGWIFCDAIGVLGNCKAYAKKVIQYIPIVGWSWKFANYIFLERSFEKDKLSIGQQIREAYDYPDPVWLLLNAEGTRFTAEKHEASVKFAEERGMPVLKHHLIPRTKGFTTSLPYVRENCNHIVDVQLAFKKGAAVRPTLTNLLFGNRVEAHLYIALIDLKTVPEDEAGAAEWLHEMFRRKDRMQESFHKTGDFFKTSGVQAVPVRPNPIRLEPLLNTIFWGIVTLTPMLYYLAKLVLSGELLYVSIVAVILTIFYLLMERSINMSKIHLGSKYGAQQDSPTLSKKSE